jgi:glycosyltransferase involved in cell wall biosynthesis
MKLEFTFILPCYNEEKTIAFCINEIKDYIKNNNLSAEVLVVDNNSTDNSNKIAKKEGARVVLCKEKGYGNALRYGTNNAKGKYSFMGDCDGSYDFSHLDEFIKELRNGTQLVVGNRFDGGIQKKAMPISHKVGVKFLSGFSNILFHTPIHDYHCGLRGYETNAIKNLNLSCSGMEYASEMIIISKINNLKMKEVPTILRKDLRNGKSNLRTIPDGFRHLNLILKLYNNRSNLSKE